jgi:hypothetical protein
MKPNAAPDIDKCIRRLMFALEHMCLNCTYDNDIHDAIKLLREQRPRVLRLDEVIALNQGGVVWLEDIDKPDVIPGLLDKVFTTTNVADFQLVRKTVTADLDEYGKRWRCWSAPPTVKERKEKRWK